MRGNAGQDGNPGDRVSTPIHTGLVELSPFFKQGDIGPRGEKGDTGDRGANVSCHIYASCITNM